MTTKARRGQKAAATGRKGGKLALRKETIRDLAAGKRQGGAVRGGAARNTPTCYGCI
jgi:hypothetical protein